MKYTVTWIKLAESQLARIWTRATDRQAVADASDRIERELASDAHRKGVPLGAFRTFTDDPLAVLFYVDPSDCMVRVVQVRQTN
ncbi:MAG: hypothetical protein ACJ8FY_21315 [Gemmataceae bacterium]